MKLRLKSTPAARALIREYEPFRAMAERDADGRWTVGYGHRAGAREDTSVSRDDAELLMIYDVLQAEGAVDESVSEDLHAPQRDALVSFAHGIGLSAFRQSAVVRLINKGRWSAAADAIAAWGGGDSPRHAAERERFLTDLPADISTQPVELVIEVEHPDFDDEETEVAAAPVADPEPPVEEPASEPEAEAEAEPVDDTETDEKTQAEPEPEAPAQIAAIPEPEHREPRRSAVAERVIARMRDQLSIREPEEQPEPQPVDTPVEADAPVEAEVPVEPEPVTGPVGFVFAEAADAPDYNDFGDTAADVDGTSAPEVEATEPMPQPAADLPPRNDGAAQDGSTGEVGGPGLTTVVEQDGDVQVAEVEADLPDPEDIASEFDTGSVVPRRNGWANGDTSPAPQRGGFPAGTVSVLGFGIAVLGAGVWDTASRWESYTAGDIWPFGPAAATAGLLLTAAATISLTGRSMRKS